MDAQASFPCKARPLLVRWALCASVSGGPLILFAMGAIMDYRVRQRFMCLLEFLYWASLCSNSYLSQFLRETGMSGVAVGSAMAAIAFVGMAAPPVFGIISDRIGSSRRVFILCWFVTAAAWLWVPLTGSTMLGGLSLAVIVMVGGSAVRLSAASILDSWMLQIQDADGRVKYATARRYGSLGYAVAAVCSGLFLVPNLGTASVFFLVPICALPVYFICRKVGDAQPTAPLMEHAVREVKRNKLGLGKLFHNYYLMTFFVCALFTYLPQYSNGTYLPYLFTEVMGDPSVIGTFTGIRAFMEVPGMLLAAVLCRRMKLRTITLAVFAYYGIEQLIYASAYSGTVLITMMLTSGVAYGFYLFAIVRYVYSLAPKNLSATAMTANAAIMAMSGIGGNFLGGVMADTVGIRSFYVLMGVLILVATAVYLGTLVLGKRLGIPSPDEQ